MDRDLQTPDPRVRPQIRGPDTCFIPAHSGWDPSKWAIWGHYWTISWSASGDLLNPILEVTGLKGYRMEYRNSPDMGSKKVSYGSKPLICPERYHARAG